MAPPVKRGVIHSKIEEEKEKYLPQIPRGVILKEKETPLWVHYPNQQTTITYVSYKRHRRSEHSHKKGQKRIFQRLKKMANNIIKKIKKRL